MIDLFPETLPRAPAEGARPESLNLSPETQDVALAMALLWAPRTQTDILDLLRLLDLRRADGRAYKAEDVKQCLRELRAQGQLVEDPHRPGIARLSDTLRVPLYRRLLETRPGERLREALYALNRFDLSRAALAWPIYGMSATVGLVRVILFTGMAADKAKALFDMASRVHGFAPLLQAAVLDGFDAASFRYVAAELQDGLLHEAIYLLGQAWAPQLLPASAELIRRLDEAPERLADYNRLALADLMLQRGDWPRFERALAGLDGGAADALRAARLIAEGRFDEALPSFEAALKRRQGEIGARKRVFPVSLAWYYPLALLAKAMPTQLEAARKFCQGESGKRTPPPDGPWGRWVHAIDVRTGRAEPDRRALSSSPFALSSPDWGAFWQVLLAAWLGPQRLRLNDQERHTLEAVAEALAERFRACDLQNLLAQLDAARAVLRGEEPPAWFFVPPARQRWREIMDSLMGLSDVADEAATASGVRLVWSLSLDSDGRLTAITPLEQKRGVRGWGKPRPISLNRIASGLDLAPYDARLTRCLRPDRFDRRGYSLDLAAAIAALVGHPHVALAEDPEQFLELVEDRPELEVSRTRSGFRLRLNPALPPPREEPRFTYGAAEDDTLRHVCVQRDGPRRLRLIRLTEGQRRIAHLLGEGLDLPAEASDDLNALLASLARQFHVLGDSEAAAQEVAPETRLRAELTPAGMGFDLRLVAAPLGAEGPRLPPGAGRERVLAAVAGQTVGCGRDLAAERRHLEAVLDALPFLAEDMDGQTAEWCLQDPQKALTVVETLPTLPAIAAVDWPKGKTLRLLPMDASRLHVNVVSERDWFRLEGEARVDEGLVLALSDLLAAARSGSRYVPMGAGVYAALTRELKERLAELAGLVEPAGTAERLPRLAAGLLAETLEALPQAQVRTDAGFRAAVERLRAAQDSTPALPGTLQAELRPYQEDGYVWAMRLAQAGLGGCLADDMGLGKTLQALAVLLARAPQGAALVVAPTSLCGNWLAEARRFAPTLNAHVYAESEREELLARAGPWDVVIVSYTLLQQAGERFAARPWHAVVADEAQAIKNAAAKRSRALFELKADFRLALSGTPVENRLGELWSVMNFVNPGLLGSESRFNERFAAPIERHKDRQAQHRLRRLIAPFVLRRTKAQVLQELPERTEQVLLVEPGPVEAAHYEALRRQAVAEAEASLAQADAGQARFTILALLTRLRRAACDPRLVTADPPIVGAKVTAFAELATELVANGHKALVFSQFVDFLQLLRQPLDAAGITYQYLDGATPSAERTRRVAAFQAGEGDLFLISLKAGGFGLNLTAADYVVITDPWWNPAAEDQAMGRAHRIGQQRPVTVYRLVTRGSIEAKILELHADKRALAEGVLSGEEGAALPPTEDLLAMM